MNNSFTFDKVHENDKESFSLKYNEIILNYLREDIYFFLLSRDYTDKLENQIIILENTFFDFGNFKMKRNIIKNITENIEIIIKELNDVGWKTFLGFGNTAIFIYSTEEKPPSCW
jgi:hypothetical protein